MTLHDANDCPTGNTKMHTDRPAGFIELDVTSAVKDWKAGKPNYGLLLLVANDYVNSRDLRFVSRDDLDTSKHAYIIANCD